MAVTFAGPRVQQSASITEQDITYVLRSAKSDTDIDVLSFLANQGIAKGSASPTMGWLFAEDPKVTRTSHKSWDAEVTYKLPESDGSNSSDQTLDAIKTEVLFEFEDGTRALEKDLDGKAITSSAGEPFDPPLEEEYSDGVIIIRRAESVVNLDMLGNLHNSVNSASYQIGSVTTGNKTVGAQKGKLKVKIGLEQEIRLGGNQVLYRIIEYRIVLKESWKAEPLDRGTYYLKDAVEGPKKKELFKDANGDLVVGLLNGTGGDLGDGNPVYLNYKVVKIKDHSTLNFPSV